MLKMLRLLRAKTRQAGAVARSVVTGFDPTKVAEVCCLLGIYHKKYEENDEKCSLLQPQFEKLLGAKYVLTSPSQCEQFSRDEGHFDSNDEVSAILKVCNENGVPVIPRGTGTGLEGGCIPIFGGVVLDLSRMDQLLEVNEVDFDCTVQAGVSRKTLNDLVRDTGLFFSVDPGADASVCGMAATSASGTTSLLYGTMKQNAKNLTVVLPNGDILYTKGKNRRPFKSSAGLNLTELFVGSEGILGVITEACVRLHPRPQAVGVAVCSFKDTPGAIESVVQLRQCGLNLARLEFLDHVQVANSVEFSHVDMVIAPTLFIEFHCQTDEDAARQAETAKEVCESNDAIQFKFSTEPADIKQLWTARHNAYYATVSKRPDAKGYTTDVCVPLSRLVEVLSKAREDLDLLNIDGAVVGHVGEGNFHCIIPTYENNVEEHRKVLEFSDRLVGHALDAGGTCTGEHGIGLGKKRYLVEEFGAVGLQAMKSIKSACDPSGIMNPGKIFSD